MNTEKLTEKLENLYNEGLNAYENENYVLALKFLFSAYKIAKKINNCIYMPKCAELLMDVCYNLSYSYYSKGFDFYEADAFSRASHNLKKAKKLAKIGCFFEKPFNETDNAELLKTIEDLFEENKEFIDERRQERWDNFKENLGDFLDFMLSSSDSDTDEVVNSDIDDAIQEDSNEIVSKYAVEISSQKLEQLKRIKFSYETSKAISSISDRIDKLLDCHQSAKEHGFTSTKEFLCDTIAYQYYSWGLENYNEAISRYNQNIFDSAKSYAKDAEIYFDKACYWVMDDSTTNYAEDSRNASHLWSNIDRAQSEYDDYINNDD